MLPHQGRDSFPKKLPNTISNTSCWPLIKSALKTAQIIPNDINCLCSTRGPGMVAPLQVAVVVVWVLSQLWKKLVVAVKHCVAHIDTGRVVTGANDPVVLYVSGGNTQMTAYSKGRYRIFGETIDIAVGNCLDRMSTSLEESTFTQWFRTDEVLAICREKKELSDGLMEKSVITYMFRGWLLEGNKEGVICQEAKIDDLLCEAKIDEDLL
ncbi:hypothetical protein ACSBR2_030316 [Camellia fascicularis]